jgi:hypothetical protein
MNYILDFPLVTLKLYNIKFLFVALLGLNHVYFVITVTSSLQSLHVLSHRNLCLCFSPIGPSLGSLLYISHYTFNANIMHYHLLKLLLKFC